MNPLLPPLIRTGATLAAFAVVASSASAQVTIPYSNDFSSGTLATNNLFSASGGTLNHTGNPGSTAGTPVAYSSVQLSNSANTSYTLSSSFRFTALDTSATALTNTGDKTFGLVAFAFNNTFLGSSNATRYLLADYTVLSTTSGSIGRLRLIEIDGSNVTLSTAGLADPNGASAGAVTLNTFYTLRLNVTNTASNTYDLSLGLFDGTNTQIGT